MRMPNEMSALAYTLMIMMIGKNKLQMANKNGMVKPAEIIKCLVCVDKT